MKNTKKILLSLALFLFAGGAASAQQNKDDVIFGALQQEIEREMEGLKLPDYTTPHYIGYSVMDIEQYMTVTASLGTIFSDEYNPRIRNVGAGIYTGTYELNSDTNYQPVYAFMRSAVENDPDQLRRSLWFISDALYKNAASVYQNKIASLNRQNISDPLPDMLRAEPVRVIDDVAPPNIDRETIRAMVTELSKIFLDFPELYGTNVTLSTLRQTTYMANSEGSMIKQPITVYIFKVNAKAHTPDGAEIEDELWKCYTADEGYPPIDEMKEAIRKMARKTIESVAAPPAEEYYYGPVMYEGEGAAATFIYTLLSPHALIAYRKPVDAQRAETTFGGRVGRRVIDSRLTVKNYSSMEEYNGRKLIGCYKVDIEGIVPPEEVTLIEKGIFHRTINSRIPTEISDGSTGSLRFGIMMGMGSIGVYPGILHVSATETESFAELKAKLIERAAEAGNDCTYIVRKITDEPELYRVDLETGEETRVRNAHVPIPALNKLDRLLGVSDSEQIINDLANNSIPMSFILPTAIIVDDIEIIPKEVKKEQLFFTKNPLLRN